ncbi:MAG: hypothetical protein A2297_04865 [Elusimicrobia bacterium RIFOXYB2_FULL_48_7]|nr:MAG: hypothetical protein A2297_04865 [Elusimicrobia bacterium RIFOXYB2_FULL_48_7]
MSKKVEKLLAKMTLEQKVGQMFVFGFSGTYPHPDIIEMIEKYNVAGFRVVPWSNIFLRRLKPGHPGIPRVTRDPQGKERVYCLASELAPFVSPEQYAKVINKLRKRSIETGAGIPVYICSDNEGGLSFDFTSFDFSGFPAPMGLAASGDPSICYKVGRQIGIENKMLGIDCIQSPTVDVKTNPNNFEIGARSYSPKADDVAKYAYQSMRGLIAGGSIPVAKHFPGRGNSTQDTHFDCPTVTEPLDRMNDIHLAPYRYLIDKGLPMIMLAHSIYPALDPSNEISTVSKPIVTGVLREQLGFKGVIITDSFTMGGLVKKYDVPEGVLRCIEAGVDLVLLKDENALRGEAYNAVLSAVKAGRIKEERVNESVTRTLEMKERFGLLDGKKGMVDPAKIHAILKSPQRAKLEKEASAKGVVVLRSEKEVMPIKKGKKVLVVEEVSWLQRRLNNSIAHSGALYERLVDNGVEAIFIKFDPENVEKALEVMKARASEVDIIIYSCTYTRGHVTKGLGFSDVAALGKPVVVVTDSPFPYAVSPEMKNVVGTFAQCNATMYAAADIISGKAKPVAKLAFDINREY